MKKRHQANLRTDVIHPTKGGRRTQSFREFQRIISNPPRNKAVAIMAPFIRFKYD